MQGRAATKAVEPDAARPYVPGVTRFTKLMAMLLLALWVPASAHCLIEVVSGLELLACDPHAAEESHQSDDCEDDGCEVVESGDYVAQFREPPKASPPTGLLIVATVVECALPVELGPSSPAGDRGPPGLSVRWQFLLRAAGTPRAPSFIS